MFNKDDPSLLMENGDHHRHSSSIPQYYKEFNPGSSLHTDPNYQYSDEHQTA
jgi:hypothetical protein